jgi:hypothetical protein
MYCPGLLLASQVPSSASGTQWLFGLKLDGVAEATGTDDEQPVSKTTASTKRILTTSFPPLLAPNAGFPAHQRRLSVRL